MSIAHTFLVLNIFLDLFILIFKYINTSALACEHPHHPLFNSACYIIGTVQMVSFSNLKPIKTVH